MRNIFTLIYWINHSRGTSKKYSTDYIDATFEEDLIAMDIEEFSPSRNALENILNFASSYEVMETKSTGFIEMNLN